MPKDHCHVRELGRQVAGADSLGESLCRTVLELSTIADAMLSRQWPERFLGRALLGCNRRAVLLVTKQWLARSP